jgi:hypothetical protein
MRFSSVLIAAGFLLAIHRKWRDRDPAMRIVPPNLVGKQQPFFDGLKELSKY